MVSLRFATPGQWIIRLENLTLRLSDGTSIVSPSSLDSSTTYVVLEQGRWFEKEWSFVPKLMRDGMTVVDVGANAGVYSLSLARHVAPMGRVVAFEPSPEARGRLIRGKELNGTGNLDIVDAALSDYEGTAVLAGGEGVDTELGAIKADGAGTPVRVTTLDLEAGRRGLTAIDFLKIDAEGAELGVLNGGRAVLSSQTPVVMFEVPLRDGQRRSPEVYACLLGLGYDLFRLVGPSIMLIPYDPDAPLDSYDLNLFAVKPDRAELLEATGLLARVPARSSYDTKASGTYAAPFASAFSWRTDVPELYLQALSAYEAWRSTGSANDRAGALAFAYDTLRVICAKSPSVPNLCTLARVAADFGSNDIARLALADVIERASHGTPVLDEPFWPASGRYDTLSPSPNPVEWFLAAVVEQQQMVRAHSSIFDGSGVTPLMQWLSKTRYTSEEMLRRLYLITVRQGGWMLMPHRLTLDAEGYLNANIWRDGKIPQRRVSP